MFPGLPLPYLTVACVLALLVTPCQPASAESSSCSDSRAATTRVFAPSSPYYRELPATTPRAAKSAKLVASLNSQAHKFYGTKAHENVHVNTNRFAPALYVAYDSDPVFDVRGWNCQHTASGWDWPYLEMMGDRALGEVAFPLKKLVALPLDYAALALGSPGETPAMTSQER